MFKVIHRKTEEIFTVYAVNCEPVDSLFLLFNDDREYPHWYWGYAEDYYPV